MFNLKGELTNELIKMSDQYSRDVQVKVMRQMEKKKSM